MNTPSTVAQGLLGRFLSRLRFPQLFLITASLFVFDFFVPDLVPFLDEIFLGLLAAMFALIKDRRAPAPAEPSGPSEPSEPSEPGAPAPSGEKDVTPR